MVQREDKNLKKFADRDIEFDSRGISFFDIKKAKLYSIIKEWDQGEYIPKPLALSGYM